MISPREYQNLVERYSLKTVKGKQELKDREEVVNSLLQKHRKDLFGESDHPKKDIKGNSNNYLIGNLISKNLNLNRNRSMAKAKTIGVQNIIDSNLKNFMTIDSQSMALASRVNAPSQTRMARPRIITSVPPQLNRVKGSKLVEKPKKGLQPSYSRKGIIQRFSSKAASPQKTIKKHKMFQIIKKPRDIHNENETKGADLEYQRLNSRNFDEPQNTKFLARELYEYNTIRSLPGFKDNIFGKSSIENSQSELAKEDIETEHYLKLLKTHDSIK